MIIGKVDVLSDWERSTLLSNTEFKQLILKYADIQIASLGNALADPSLSIENLRLIQWETRAMLKLKNFFWQSNKKD
jgi:hypothetical protein